MSLTHNSRTTRSIYASSRRNKIFHDTDMGVHRSPRRSSRQASIFPRKPFPSTGSPQTTPQADLTENDSYNIEEKGS
ncbi:hypothetical protein BS47DRAFT_1351877 [Hydnum rufescens UP504]|uniref:Uncharacterized protein n=1 Tax=Hydnum rufescens UP504 TaxID=1448309 RepID=A0A9P6AK76_9AGAM|nr:hypothetical protein BS47DRAFT_1351877 [Hydnum rufescens UP504]